MTNLKKIFDMGTIQNILMTCCLVSDRCPLGYLFLLLLTVFLLYPRHGIVSRLLGPFWSSFVKLVSGMR